MKKINPKFFFVLKFLISALLLYYIVRDVNFSEIFNSIEHSNFLILLLAFSLHGVGLYISALRWKILLKTQQVETKVWFLFKSYLVATFFNHFLPSTVGGDSVRAYDSYKLNEDKANAFAVVVVDRFMGLLTLLLFVIISMFFSEHITKNIPDLNLWVGLMIIGFIGIIWFVFTPDIKLFETIKNSRNKITSKIGSLLYKLANAFWQFSKHRSTLIEALFLSILLQANVVTYYYLIAVGLDLPIDYLDFYLIVPLTIFIMMLPISVNGIGLRENAFYFFFIFYGIAKSQAIAFAWIEFGMLLVLGIIGGITYALRKH